jgi:S1-C subfamily serine protease
VRLGFLLLTLLWVAPSAVWAQGDPSDEAPDALAPPPPLHDAAPAGDPADDGPSMTPGPEGDAPPAPTAGTLDPSDQQLPATGGDADIARIAGPSVVRVRARLDDGRVRHASGVFVGPRAVATTYTALRGAVDGEIDLGGDPRPFTIDGVVGIDETRDLAIVVLRERDVGSRPVALADALPAEGDVVWAIAFPQSHTTSRPEIVAGRALRPTRRGTLLSDHQPEKGTPGGALVDARGRLVGVLLPGLGPDGAARAANVDDVRYLLAHRHKPVRLANLERFLDEGAEGALYGEPYTDDGYADNEEGYTDLDEREGSTGRRREPTEGAESSNKNDVACLLAGCFVAPPIAMAVGTLAAMFGVCAIYGCGAAFLLASTAGRLAIGAAAVGAAVALLAGVVAGAALLMAAAPGLTLGVAVPGALVLAGGAGAMTIAAGSVAASGVALAFAWRDEPEEGEADAAPEQPPTTGSVRQGLREAY